jgi:hypothetical protein
MNTKLKPRPVATGSRLRGNNQAGKLISPKYTPPTALPQAVHCGDRAAPINAAAAHRRLQLRGYIAAEPRRPKLADIEAMIAELPYGYWRDTTRRLVVFNRRYRPLWQRMPTGEIERADANEWVSFVEQRWFDFTDVRYEKSARERLRQILREFFSGKDLAAHTIITEWDRDDGQRGRRKAVRP